MKTADQPSEIETRAALARLLVSPIFQTSPKLSAFLRYVVERTLAGQGTRIKSYTIAVEALGRSAEFDPQIDPIVRVEAGRLRRALGRYYAREGIEEPILIELPRGNYAPIFRRRTARPSRTFGLDVARNLGRMTRIRVMTLALGILFVAGLLAALGVWPGIIEATTKRGLEIASGRAVTRPVFPVLVVQPFDEIGVPIPPNFAANLLRRKVSDALSLFDEIQVRSAAEVQGGRAADAAPPVTPDATTADYLLAATVDHQAEGGASLTLRLADTSISMNFWSRTFDLSGIGGDGVVRQIAATLAQPYGVIYARNQDKLAAGQELDPRLACLLNAFDAWPSYDATKDEQARVCLQRETTRDPTFSAGFAALATVYLREYTFGYPARSEQAAVLDHALAVAQRAVNLKPASARAYQSLMDVHFARGELDQMAAVGSRAVLLNPYDTYVLGTFGMRLIFMGDVEEGLPMLKTYLEYRKGSMGRANFALFLSSYLLGDFQTAKSHARQITSDGYPLRTLARVLVAQALGERVKANIEFNRLAALNAAWSDDPRAELAKFFPSPKVVDRLATALLAARGMAAN